MTTPLARHPTRSALVVPNGCGSIATHVREMARALGKYQEKPVWQADPDAPMSETEFNWERRQGA